MRSIVEQPAYGESVTKLALQQWPRERKGFILGYFSSLRLLCGRARESLLHPSGTGASRVVPSIPVRRGARLPREGGSPELSSAKAGPTALITRTLVEAWMLL